MCFYISKIMIFFHGKKQVHCKHMLQEIQNKSSSDISAHRSILVNVYRTNNLWESKARERERRQKGKSFGSNTFYVYQEF